MNIIKRQLHEIKLLEVHLVEVKIILNDNGTFKNSLFDTHTIETSLLTIYF